MPRNKTEKVNPFPPYDGSTWGSTSEVSEWLGHTITSIKGAESGSDEVIFEIDGATFKMFHLQDCCEDVHLDDVTGDIEDLIGQPLTMSEEVSNSDGELVQSTGVSSDDSHTWTFYKLATLNGYVTFRWFGSSNGYYSENVDIWRTG